VRFRSRELDRLRLDRVVIALDSEQRPDAGEQLVPVERLGNEVVRSGLDRGQLLGADARREHDHRRHRRLLLLPEPLADFEPVGRGHHHVEEHEVRLGGHGQLEGSLTVGGGDDVVALCLEHGLEQTDVLGDIVDDEDPRRPVAHRPLPSQ
jgi:hypothetical protein